MVMNFLRCSGDFRLVSAPGGIAGATAVTARATASSASPALTSCRHDRETGWCWQGPGACARRSVADESAIGVETRPREYAPGNRAGWGGQARDEYAIDCVT